MKQHVSAVLMGRASAQMRYPMTYNIRNLCTGELIAFGLHHGEAVSFINRNRELRLGLENV